MMEYTLLALVEKIFGYMLFLVGLAILIQHKHWVQMAKYLRSLDKKTFSHLSTFCAYIFLPLGLFVVFAHNVWELNSSVVVTLLGWVVVLKCLSILFYPKAVAYWMKVYDKSEELLKKFFIVFGAIYTVLGVWVLSAHWF